MEKKWFSMAGDLEPSQSNSNGSYLKMAGDLEPRQSNSNGSYLKMAGDLDVPKENNSFKFVEKEPSLMSPDEIRAWLKTIVSGREMANYGFGEENNVVSSGKMFVSIDTLKKMIDNGDNIIKAEYIEGLNCVDIEFERFRTSYKSR